MSTSIRDWPILVRKCKGNTIAGGYCEFTDYDIQWASPDGSLKEDGFLLTINREFFGAIKAQGTEANPGQLLEGISA